MRDRPLWITALGLAFAAAAAVHSVTDPVASRPRDRPSAQPSGADFVTLDPFHSGGSEVTRWHQAGYSVRCQLRAGIWEPGRPDAARFAAAVLGQSAGGGARWLDVRRWDLLEPILDDRLALCSAKGFDGVALSDVNAAGTGFALAQTDHDRFLDRLRALASARGLTVSVRPAAAGVADTAGRSTTIGS